MRICAGLLVAIGLCVLVACGGGGGRADRKPAPEQEAVHVEPAARSNPDRAAKIEQAEKAEKTPADRDREERSAQAEARKHERELDGSVDYAARQFAIRIFEDVLKSPTSAQYPSDSIGVSRMTDVGTGNELVRRWRVSGAVDSQNSFGAMIRGKWNMEVAHAGDKFFPVTAWLDGKMVFQDPKYLRLAGAALAAEAQAAEDAERERKDAKVAAAKEAASKRDPEEKASADLKLVKALIAQGRKAPAKKRLEELIEKYPDTEAAAEAGKLLEKTR